MNKKFYIISIIAVLVLLSAVLLSRSQSTIKKELRDFAVEDTSLVDKVFLADKKNNTILIERGEDLWILNGKHYARRAMVNHLLGALQRMKVKEPVADAARENIIKSLAANSTKVEVYQKGELVRTFYVGSPTQDSYGTYMIMENSSMPFVVEIPGFRGFISVRFTTIFNRWLSNEIFKIPYSNVAEIKYQNYLNPEQSYRITKDGEEIKVFGVENGKEYSRFDTLKVMNAIGCLKSLAYSKVVEDVPDFAQDSIVKSSPMLEIMIKETSGKETKLVGFVKPGWGKVDAFGEPVKVDYDNFFLLLEDSTFTYAQYYAFNNLLTPLSSMVNK